MAEKKYPPGSIGAQLQARGVPEDKWGEEVQGVRDRNAQANEAEKVRRKKARLATKNIARGIVRGDPTKVVRGVTDAAGAAKAEEQRKRAKGER